MFYCFAIFQMPVNGLYPGRNDQEGQFLRLSELNRRLLSTYGYSQILWKWHNGGKLEAVFKLFNTILIWWSKGLQGGPQLGLRDAEKCFRTAPRLITVVFLRGFLVEKKEIQNSSFIVVTSRMCATLSLCFRFIASWNFELSCSQNQGKLYF